MERLQSQNFRQGFGDIVLLCTAGKGEDSWTPAVNAVIDMGEQIAIDFFGFLNLMRASEASITQRRGRGGRYHHSLYAHIESPLARPTDWCLPYEEQLKVVLASLDLGYVGPIPGIEPGRRSSLVEDLVKLGVCQLDEQDVLRVTSVGDEICRGDMDIRLTVMMILGRRFGIGRYVELVAAFLAAGMELFVNMTPMMRSASRLLPSQVALGEGHGDVHTAVKWFLVWESAGGTLPEEVAP